MSASKARLQTEAVMWQTRLSHAYRLQTQLLQLIVDWQRVYPELPLKIPVHIDIPESVWRGID